MRTALSRSRARRQALPRLVPSCTPDRLRHLVADREERIERGHGVLQDHGDALAAYAAHVGVRLLQQVLTLEQHAAARHAGRWRQQAQDGERQRAFPGPRLADDPSVSPALMRRLTPSTAHDPRTPRRDIVGGGDLKLEQRRNSHQNLRAVVTGIELHTEPIAEKVCREHHQHDADARQHGEPPVARPSCPSCRPASISPQAGLGGGTPDAEEGQRRLR
jgi:hypothetical protein